MNTIKLKSEFHKLIDEVNDNQLLQRFYDLFSSLNKKNKSLDIIDELSVKQQQRLEESIKQVRDGKTVSNDEMKNELRKWLTS
ncbi:MAG: hypothetical protein ACJ76F_12695 [Bacteroidia bacterium]